MHDIRLLLWLRVRHIRTFLLRLAHFAGSDPSVDRGASDRIYQVYVAVAVFIGVALVWFAFMDAVERTFAAAGALLAGAVVPAVLLAAVAVFAYLSVRGLRTAPVRLSHPDIAYVASSPIATRALVADAAGASLLPAAVCGAMGGFVLGCGLVAAVGAPSSPGSVAVLGASAFPGLAIGSSAAFLPAAMALVCGALLAAAAGGAWIIGLVRLVVSARRRRTVTRASAGVVVIIGVVGATGALVGGPGLLAVGASGLSVFAAGALASVALEIAALAVLAPHVDMVAVAQESSLAADLDPFGPFSPLDPNVKRDYRRRMNIARRGPRFRLPDAYGRAMLIARAALSLVRQREGLLALAMLGACVTPLGVMALFGVGAPVTLLFWLMMLVLVQPTPPREASRAFRDDIRVRLVRDRLPFGTLELLILDSLPVFVLITVLTCAVIPIALPAGAPLGAALALGTLLNAATLLCAGLEAVRLHAGGPRPWSEGGLAALVMATGMLSFAGVPGLTIAGAAAVCIVVALVVRIGVESA